MLVRIVGLGPGDPDLLTLGSVKALQAIGRAVTPLAPPDLTKHLERAGIVIVRGAIADPPLFVRGSTEIVAQFVEHLPEEDLAIGILGNPLSDFPGLPPLLRELERRGARSEIVPGFPRAALSAALTMPLVPYLIEETYEVVEAIEGDDESALCEELGDLLLQIVFHAQLGSETGKFTVADVIDALSNKMIRRHPHVFGDAVIEDVDTQWKNWEKLKAEESTGRKRRSRLDGIPKHLGALQRGQRMQEKAARVGFDWPAARGILDKLHEELGELEQAEREKQDDPHVREELGDVFFTLVNLARAMGIDAEAAMREANEKFHKRFAFMEQHAAKDGKSLSDMSLDELEELWQLAKSQAA